MSVPTVKTHLRHVFETLDISNRAQLTARAVQHKR
jgi:DNA-binding CsgD family transcriptional regulator